MLRIKSLGLLSFLALALGSKELLASSNNLTYVAGNCKPGLPGFSTISAALAATPSPNVVLVCPGTYNEQVVITQPVTLEGVSTGDSAQAIIAPPGGGLVANATDDFGDPVAAQLWSNNVTGSVTVSDITLDAAGNGVPSSSTFIVGLFYQNSAGTVNRVTTRNQRGNRSGIGVLIEGGAANPSVTVENSSIHDFDNAGIFAETNSGTPELTSTIKSNNVNGSSGSLAIDVVIDTGATGIVTKNFVAASFGGIFAVSGSSGSISGNTFVNDGIGVFVGADGISVTTNKILSSSFSGIELRTSVASIQNNDIIGSSVGIEFNCTANGNVHSNAITDTGRGLDQVPSGVATSNSYFNVGTIRTGC